MNINGVIHKSLKSFHDHRGWVTEMWRSDEVGPGLLPAMTYISQTKPGVTRGPHEHKNQTDCFAFVGPGTFKVFLWDNRADSPTYGAHMQFEYGEDNPGIVIVPPGVVHGYHNVSSVPGMVINSPNRLYAGEGRKEPVDQIRWEDQNSQFIIEA